MKKDKEIKQMLKRLTIAMLVFGAVACSQDNGNNKEARLKEVKQQIAELKKEEAQLERDLGKKDNKASGNKTNVVVAAVSPDTFTHYLEVQGRIESDKNIFLTPKAPGAVVTDIKVKTGDRVSKGQLLATLDGGALLRSMAEVENQLDLATTVYKKQKNLWDQKIGTEIQYLQARNNKESLERRLATLQEQYSNYQMRSPINGTVDDVALKLGEVPTPGMAGIRVVNYDDSKVTADISEAYSGQVNKGDKAIVRLPDLGKEYTSKVSVVSKVISTNNRTFSIEVPINKDLEGIRPNMIAVLKLNDYTNTNVITVPLNLVQRDEKNEFIYIAVQKGNETIARKKLIRTGKRYDGIVEVLEGLNNGDKIITSGYQNVVDGQTITIK